MKELWFCVGFAVGMLINSVLDGFYLVSHGDQSERKFRELMIRGGAPRYRKREPVKVYHFHDAAVHRDERTVADRLAAKIRVVCFVVITKGSHRRIPHIKATWGKRCTKLVFMGKTGNASLGVEQLDVSGKATFRWSSRVMLGVEKLYDNHLDEADWFLKGTANGFVIMENLRLMLSNEDSNRLVYFTNSHPDKKNFDSGDFVLSKAALKKLVEEGIRGKQYCLEDFSGNQVEEDLSVCLDKLGVTKGKTVDEDGKSRFNSFNPKIESLPGQQGSLDTVSDKSITFHQVAIGYSYVLEYFVYHLRPYGIKIEHANEDH